MSEIEKDEIKDFINSLKEIENEVKILLFIKFLYICGMNEEQIVKWFEELRLEKGV